MASTMTRADLTTLLAETTLLYPFIKCEITIVVQEGSDGGSTEQIVQKALETGLATADGDIIALEIATPKGEGEAEADSH